MFKIFEKIKNLIAPKSVGLNDPELLEWLGIDTQTPRELLSEVTYFTCLKMLAETKGKLSMKFYQETSKGVEKAKPNKAFKLLQSRPNRFMTPSIFWATVENNRNHYGNAYVWIRKRLNLKKYGGSLDVQDLWILPSKDVQVVMDDKGIFGDKGDLYYIYNDAETGEQYVFNSDEIMHFKTSTTFDGVIGKPVIEILKDTVSSGLESQKFMNNLYKNGLSAKLVMQYTGDLNEEKEKALIRRYEKFLTGTKNAGKIATVPLGIQLQPLDIKLTDSQFFELKKFTALQIAGAFGIKPNQINDYEKSSYSNSETQQLSFYVDTELFILKQYEEEINYKLLTEKERDDGYYFKHNEKAILRTDSKTQKDILTGYVNNGIYTPNEARALLDLQQKEGGDVLMMNGNYIPIQDVGKQYLKGGE